MHGIQTGSQYLSTKVSAKGSQLRGGLYIYLSDHWARNAHRR